MAADPRWVGMAAPSARPDVYLIEGGHGAEEIDWVGRQVLPAGYRLIVLGKSGSMLFHNENRFKLLDQFKNPLVKRMIENNPLNAKKFIENKYKIPVRIYEVGDRIPTLTYIPLANAGAFLQHSGIVSLPIRADRDIRETYPLDGNSDTLLQIYRDSLYPIDTTARNFFAANGNDYRLLEETFSVNVFDIMTRIGPGTYIYLVCRSSTLHFPAEEAFVTHTIHHGLPFGFTEEMAMNFPEHMRRASASTGVALTPRNLHLEGRIGRVRTLSNVQQIDRIVMLRTLENRARAGVGAGADPAGGAGAGAGADPAGGAGAGAGAHPAGGAGGVGGSRRRRRATRRDPSRRKTRKYKRSVHKH